MSTEFSGLAALLTLLSNLFLISAPPEQGAEKELAPPAVVVELPETVMGSRCGEMTCDELLGELVQRYPRHGSEFVQDCEAQAGLAGLTLYEHTGSRVVGLTCWDAEVVTEGYSEGYRSGLYFGALPYPGDEAEFPMEISSDDPTEQAVLERYPEQVAEMAFDCALVGGSINILNNAEQTELQCFFWAGAQPLDTDGDFVSDGEVSMGASVDFIRGLGEAQ